MKKINFTKVHEEQLKNVAVELLFSGTSIKGLAGTQYTVFDMLHNVTVNTVVTMYTNLKKEIEKLEGLDEWSMNDYQQRKLAESKKMYDFLNLTIGWRKYQEQIANDKAQVRALKAKLKELKMSSMTPAEQMKELETQITSMGGSLEDESE